MKAPLRWTSRRTQRPRPDSLVGREAESALAVVEGPEKRLQYGESLRGDDDAVGAGPSRSCGRGTSPSALTLALALRSRGAWTTEAENLIAASGGPGKAKGGFRVRFCSSRIPRCPPERLYGPLWPPK